MFEKVNPSHPDKIADRIAGAMVDAAYSESKNPRIACEVLTGHGRTLVICETSVSLKGYVLEIVHRIAGETQVSYVERPQNSILAANQREQMRCGDNGIFCGMPITAEQRRLSSIARRIYSRYPTDGKCVIHGGDITICQSCATEDGIKDCLRATDKPSKINPLGKWKGGLNVDAGATNRKLGSDMGDAVTGGGLHGKDLSKADVSVNIWAHVMAQELHLPLEVACSIGDTKIGNTPYAEVVEIARDYIIGAGGFERFAEWGLI
ncbi:S-adenosylmethionine synthetase N-terminal domain-containing protein [uncultured Olegusella sp.]|uniref:S-adenosylmethionine synthetase N-terminal domain-containing protein n=1 Tax=uncultured Olegusella sp. TaxID=1979846 RepID=UPI002639A8CE|nr:S-adenosylmethionine synthetase N-terminal domain-containing protein [uncultured Olegusella sp.]